MVGKEQINNIIDNILQYRNDVTEEEKCSKPHIQSLPYDGYARTEGKLERRKEAIDEAISERKKKIEENEKEIKSLQERMDNYQKEMNNLQEDTISQLDESLERGQKLFEDLFGDGSDDDVKVYWEDNGRGNDYNTLIKKFNELGKENITLEEYVNQYLKGNTTYDYFKMSRKEIGKIERIVDSIDSSMKSIQNKKNGDKLIFKTNFSDLNKFQININHVNMYLQNYRNEKTGYDNAEYEYRSKVAQNKILQNEIKDLEDVGKKNDEYLNKLE